MDRYSVSRTKRLLFYIIMTFLTVGFIVAECVLPSERSTSTSDENITYDGSFTWLWKDDRNEKTEFFKTMAMAERMIEKHDPIPSTT